jgi:tetratricopeptide (TPR) repeat protein
LALAPLKENAEEVFGIALSLYEDIGNNYSIARGLYYLGLYLRRQNQTDKARAVLRQSLELFETLDLPPFVAATVRQALDSIN